MNRSWIELDFSALRNNIRLYQQYLPQGCKIMGVIKANAYGHGARTVALALEEMGIDFFAVATIDEAVEIRLSKISLGSWQIIYKYCRMMRSASC
jgi:alanine racemase